MAHAARSTLCRFEAGAGEALRRKHRAWHIDPRTGRAGLLGRALQALGLRELVDHSLRLGVLAPAPQSAAPPCAAARSLRERQRRTARGPRCTPPPAAGSADR